VTDVTLVASIPIQPWKILIIMKTLLVIPMALLLALSVIPAWAKSDNGNGKGQVKGALAPLVGAGLPVLLVGGGIYWIMRRRKRRARSSNDR